MPGYCPMGTRVDHGEGPGGKNMKSGAMSNGGPVANPRAQKPVKGSDNSATSKSSPSAKTTRPSTGAK